MKIRNYPSKAAQSPDHFDHQDSYRGMKVIKKNEGFVENCESTPLFKIFATANVPVWLVIQFNKAAELSG